MHASLVFTSTITLKLKFNSTIITNIKPNTLEKKDTTSILFYKYPVHTFIYDRTDEHMLEKTREAAVYTSQQHPQLEWRLAVACRHVDE